MDGDYRRPHNLKYVSNDIIGDPRVKRKIELLCTHETSLVDEYRSHIVTLSTASSMYSAETTPLTPAPTATILDATANSLA